MRKKEHCVRPKSDPPRHQLFKITQRPTTVSLLPPHHHPSPLQYVTFFFTFVCDPTYSISLSLCFFLFLWLQLSMALLVQRLAAGSAPFPISHASCEVVGPRVYLFGGHNGKTFSSDLNILETSMQTHLLQHTIN